MKKLEMRDYELASDLLSHFKYQTVLKTILSGQTPGKVYCDQLHKPQVVFVQFKQRAFIAGDPAALDPSALKTFFETRVIENCRQWNVPLFRLTAEPPTWIDPLGRILEPRQPISALYHCYQYAVPKRLPEIKSPENYSLREVTPNLIAENFEGKDDLLEEMCSERDSVKSFLEHSFGIAAFRGPTLAGWCLSEYNHTNQCEVGIATMTPFQKQGLAKSMTRAFIHLAASEGIKTILWHCYQSNEPSWRTAISVGFRLAKEEMVLMQYHERALNAAVHGNLYFEQKQYQKAVEWYQSALLEPAPQSWMAWNGACAAARCGQVDLAFKFLDQAVDLGFADLDHLVQSRHFFNLKDDPRWREIITRLRTTHQAGSNTGRSC